MGNFSAPEISHRSKIYLMARDRNYKVLITSFAVFIFGIVSMYDGIVRPGAQTPAGVVLNFIIIGISFYGFYLFLARSRDVFRHPDVKKFLSSGDPSGQIDRFEQEYKDGSLKKFRDGFVTRNFVITQTFYRFRWAHSREITMAYVERAQLSFHRMPLPFLGISTVMIHLNNGTALHINCDSKEEAETLLKLLAEMAPQARYGSAIYQKTDPTADAIAQDVAATIRQMPDLRPTDNPANQPRRIDSPYIPAIKKTTPDATAIKKTTPDAQAKVNELEAMILQGSTRGPPVVTVKPEPASTRPLSKDEIFNGQIKNLYDSIEKEDIATSVAIIDSMGDTGNVDAADILGILLDYPVEPLRVHVAIALGNLGQKSSVEQLVRALDDKSVQVRENAAIALGKIGDQCAVAPLQQVSTADVRVKKAAVGALARIDQKLCIYNQPGSSEASFFSTPVEKY